MTGGVLFCSARLGFRPMMPADAPAFDALVTRPDAARMLLMFPTDRTLPEARVIGDARAWQGRLGFRLAIDEAGHRVGWIGASDDAEPEIFFALESHAAGRGLAREAVAAFAAFVFDCFDLPALRAGVFSDDPASARVLVHCGLARVDALLHASRGRVAPAPCWVYRLDRQAGSARA
jgi:RimJ/RimL family protein N-acetyltransferase